MHVPPIYTCMNVEGDVSKYICIYMRIYIANMYARILGANDILELGGEVPIKVFLLRPGRFA